MDLCNSNSIAWFCSAVRSFYSIWNLMSFCMQMLLVGEGWHSGRNWGLCGSVHHSIIYIENPTSCNSVSKFYFIFIWSSTCFGRHTAHHQEPKTALVASGFAYVEGSWTCSCWMLSGRVWKGAVHFLILYLTAYSNYTSNNLPRMQNLMLLVQL